MKAAALLLILTSCNYMIDKQKNLPVSISYDTVRTQIFEPHCTSCHGNAGGVNLQSYDGVVSNINAIERAVLVEKTMPKNGSLSQNLQNLLKSWIDAGTPLGRSNPTPPIPFPQSVESNYQSIHENLLKPKCLVCHVRTNDKVSHYFETYEDLLQSDDDLVIPGKPSDSLIYQAVTRERFKMPPVNSKIDKLTDLELKALYEWIEQGAKP